MITQAKSQERERERRNKKTMNRSIKTIRAKMFVILFFEISTSDINMTIIHSVYYRQIAKTVVHVMYY